MQRFLTPSPFKIGLLCTLLMSFLVVFDPGFLQVFELKMLDQRFVNRGELKPGSEVVIAVIDEKSQDILGRWPWDRAVLAKLVDRLVEGGAWAIGFDMVFSETGDDAHQKAVRLVQQAMKLDQETIKIFKGVLEQKTGDQLFAESIERANNVVLGFFFHDSREDVVHLSSKKIKAGLQEIIPSSFQNVEIKPGANIKKVFESPAVEPNLPMFAEASEGWGYFNLSPDPDGIMRHYPLILRVGKHHYAPMFLKVLELFLESKLGMRLGPEGVENINIGEEIEKIPVDEYGRFLINYYGGAKLFPHIPIVDIIEGKVPRSELEDRIVLVGATGKGIFDLRATPFEGVYPGVEINATVIDNILQNNFLVKPPSYMFTTFVFIFAIGLVLSFVLSRTKAVIGFLVTALFFVAYYFFNQKLFNEGQWFNLVYPSIQIIAVYTSITAYNYFTETKQKVFINDAFGQYLSPAVIDRLIDNPDLLKLGGTQKRLTAFFSDVARFSTISENLTPMQLVDLLNEYLTAMTNIILEYEGTVDKYEGDAIIAFFGAPLDYADHAARGCLVSLAMQKKLVQMREQWREQGKDELHVRIGLNTGSMIIGNMGSNFRMDYTMMGDSVNLASRLEGVNKAYGTSIMISQFTYQDVQDIIEVRELDKIRVVGKVAPVTIYEVLEKKGELSEEWQKLLPLFGEGLEYYRGKEWEKALEKFHQSLAILPEDGPSEVFIHRCEEFQREAAKGNTLPLDWDGVYQMQSK